MSERRFRIMGGPSLPWSLVEPYDDNAKNNHDQTLEELNRRGGLAPGELWCVVHGKRLRELPKDEAVLPWLHQWLADYETRTFAAERDNLKSQRDLAIKERDEARAMSDALNIACNACESTIATWQPIIELAKEWRMSWPGRWDHAAHGVQLRAALDALAALTPPTVEDE